MPGVRCLHGFASKVEEECLVKSFYAKKIQETCGRDSADEDLRRSDKVQVRRHNIGFTQRGEDGVCRLQFGGFF